MSMKWEVTRIRKWPNWPGTPVEIDEIAEATGTPENWLRENMPGILNYGSDQRAGMQVDYTVTYDNGDQTTWSFVRTESN